MNNRIAESKGTWGLPGGSVGKNLSARAGDTGLIPGPGAISHASEQLRLWPATVEPAL